MVIKDNGRNHHNGQERVRTRINPIFALNDHDKEAPFVHKGKMEGNVIGLGPVDQMNQMVMVDREQIAKVIHQDYGPLFRRVCRLRNWRPYGEEIESLAMPKGYKVPNFTTFFREGDQSTIEHVNHFIVQCDKVGGQGDYLLKYSQTL